MDAIMTWIGPALDVAAVGLLALVLWRLGRDPEAPWNEHETHLRAIFDDLRALVAQSEGLARDLDEKLAGREARLTALLADAEALVTTRSTATAVGRADRIEVRGAAPPPEPASSDPEAAASRIEALAEEGVGIEEIARRVGVATAEVRLVIGLKAARAARRKTAGPEASAHA